MSQVGDYDIANASGASVRSDLNLVFDAVKTCNSGPNDPPNPTDFMLYGDSGDNKLKIYDGSQFRPIGEVNKDNLGLLPRSGGTSVPMTGQLIGDDASGSGSPAFAFDNNADTGMFRSGPNAIGFSTAGTSRVVISNSGLDITNGLPLRLQDSSGAPFVGLKSPTSVSSNITFSLPASDGNAGEFLQTDGSGNLSFSAAGGAQGGVPSGAVFCMAVAIVPSGYLECNGAAVSRTGYAALFAVIGTQYGAGNGSSTFNLPDLRGEFVRGYDHGRGIDSGRSISATPQSDQNKQHNHTASSSVNDSGHVHGTTFDNKKYFPGGNSTTVNYGGPGEYPADIFSMSSATTGVTVATSIGNDGGGETRPRNIAMMYVIKT